jgi:hypothetical protein
MDAILHQLEQFSFGECNASWVDTVLHVLVQCYLGGCTVTIPGWTRRLGGCTFTLPGWTQCYLDCVQCYLGVGGYSVLWAYTMLPSLLHCYLV